jgi:hypothetical protein
MRKVVKLLESGIGCRPVSGLYNVSTISYKETPPVVLKGLATVNDTISYVNTLEQTNHIVSLKEIILYTR